MKQKEFMRWEKYRKLGRVKFILLWGLYFIVLINVINFIGDIIRNRPSFGVEDFLVRGIIAAAFGILSGTSMWMRNEKDYIEHLRKKNSAN